VTFAFFAMLIAITSFAIGRFFPIPGCSVTSAIIFIPSSVSARFQFLSFLAALCFFSNFTQELFLPCIIIMMQSGIFPNTLDGSFPGRILIAL
jgi:hypothetical protein